MVYKKKSYAGPHVRQINLAVKRERFPIPTIDEALQDLNQSKFFSKLDLTSAYHQIEMSPESRDITTFGTHKGLYRYKRLMFGISCAPEMYQMVLHQVLQECDGAHNILDDVIVHTPTEEEHDKRFENVVRVLSSRGLTLNRDKCQFKMSYLEFMGHVLSARGIGPANVKVKAVVDAREPTNAAEVRSFLGLVNFTARFIPDLATVSAPLRQLTKSGEPFVWGPEQQQSFDELKKRLSSAETLGYFDKNAPAKVIAEASPVGLGAVLVQEQGEELRVISYASRSLPLRTDNGRHFTSEHLTKYLEENGIEHRGTTLLWPQANGEKERQNRSILRRLRIAQAEGRNRKSEMDNFLMMYRSTPHFTTGVSPAELLFRRRIRTKLPHLQEFGIEDEDRDRDGGRKAKGKVYAECQKNARESEIREGDKVLLRQEKENKLSTPYK